MEKALCAIDAAIFVCDIPGFILAVK